MSDYQDTGDPAARAEMERARQIRHAQDLAAWATDAEAERSALLAISSDALDAEGYLHSDIQARAKALRARSGVPHA